MAMDSSECNGSGGSPKVELETKTAGELGSDKDLPKSDAITSPQKEENDAEGIGGPFVFVNEDSDDPSEKDLDLIEKSDLAAVGEDKDHPSQINAGQEIGLKEEAESENARDPVEGVPSVENSGAELGVKVEKESTDNGELSEKVVKEITENGELGEKVEKESTENGEIEEKVEEESIENGELIENTESKTESGESEKKDSSEETVVETIPTEKGDEKEGSSEEAPSEELEIVAEKSEEKSGGEAERELELAPSEELEKESDLGVKEAGSEVKTEEPDYVAEPKAESGVVVPEKESVVEESGAQLISESAETTEKEEEKPEEIPVVMGESVENGEKEEEVAGVEEQKDEKSEQPKKEEVQEQISEEVKDEQKEEVSECLEGEKEEVEAPETDSAAEAVVEPAVEAEKKQENETVVGKSGRWADEEEPEETVASDDHVANGHEESEPVPVHVQDKPEELALESEPVVSNNVEETQAETEDSEIVTNEPSQTQEVEEIQKPEAEIDAEGDINNSDETDASKHDAESSNEVKVESEDKCTDETDAVEDVAESSDEVKVESENKCTERDIDLSEAKTEVAPQQQYVDESVQIGNFTINIGENGPACLNEEVQPVVVSESSVVVSAPQETGTSTAQSEKAVDSQIQSKRIFFMMKVPRYSDEEQLAKIRDAQAHLDDLTRKREAIWQLIHKKRILNKDSWDEVQKAREEERAARAVFNAKRHEISSVQAVINKLNKANSIDDMDDLIDAKEKSMQHETMSLKQEKMLLQEIKELKSKRKQLVDNMGSAAEIDEAFDQRDSVYDKLRTLKTELDVVGKTLSKAEEKTRELQNKYDETERSLCDSQDAHKAAHDVRQNAFLRWRQLKAELGKRNKHFYGYMDDRTARAKYIVPTLDPGGLDSYCNNQMEKVMEMWNKDEGFRKQYIEMNKVSTIRRLGCLDGRALAPDEAPTVLPPPSTSYNRTATPLPTTTQLNLQKTSHVSFSNSVVDKMKDLQFPALPQIKPKPTPNKSKASSSKDPAAAAAEREAEIEKAREAEEEKERKKRDEEERGRLREDEIRRKAKAEAQEKERLREEQKAKAKEAEERKKRKAEKAQERAEQFKARKEAEIRDKKRTKKDKKKGGSEVDSDDTSENNGSESAVHPREISTAAAPSVPGVAKRAVRPQVAMKQLKRVEPVPVALRNRNKKKMRTWLIGIATAVAAILTVFLIGNYVSWSDVSSLFYA